MTVLILSNVYLIRPLNVLTYIGYVVPWKYSLRVQCLHPTNQMALIVLKQGHCLCLQKQLEKEYKEDSVTLPPF